MSKFLNSPLFIALLVIASFYLIKTQTKPVLASEISGVYEEVIRIAEEGGSDIEKTKALESFAKEVASQLRSGFSMGFASEEKEKEESREAKFLRIKEAIKIIDYKELETGRNSTQEFVYRLKNESDLPIRQIRINYEYYYEDTLIDAENDWISEIKVLAPNESIALKQNRNLPRDLSDEALAAASFDRVEISITSFDTVDD